MMHATAGRSPARLAPKATASFDTGVEGDAGAGPFASLSRVPSAAPIRRKCAACDQDNEASMTLSPQLEVGAINDPAEREADAVADQVMSADAGSAAAAAASSPQAAPIRTKSASGAATGGQGTMAVAGAQASAIGALGGGEPMPVADRAFFEPRLGQDLSHVRLHRGAQAENAAAGIGARAFTMGTNIVFGKGEYGADHSARHLLAHELAHVQQNDGVVRMAQLDIVDAGMVGPLQANQRRAAASCPINCGGTDIGTFHAMPILSHSGATGVEAALHFIRNSAALSGVADCSTCSTFKVIQVISTNASLRTGGATEYVDNNERANVPYYTDVFLSGRGPHTIDSRFSDGGNQVDSAISLYDRPYRPDAYWSSRLAQDMSWQAEAHVVCVKSGTSSTGDPDRILGGIGYGFTRRWNASNSLHEAAIPTGPSCRSAPSAAFLRILRADSSVSSYRFTT